MLGFVVNPVAGNGASLRAIAEVRKVLDERKIKYAIEYTEYEAHGLQVVEQFAKRGISTIIAVGGDGTALECAQGIFKLGEVERGKISFGLIPSGSGNDFARTLNIPSDPIKAAEILLAGETVRCDMLNCNGIPVLNIASLGIDSEIVSLANKIKPSFGKFSYVASVVKNIFTYKSIKAELNLGGRTINSRFTILAMCNGRYYGGGFHIAPVAEIDDSKITVVYVDYLPWYKMLVLFPLVPFGRHLGLKEVHIENCDYLEVKYNKDYVFNTDGNIVNIDGFVNMKIEPAVLNVIKG